MDRARQVLVQGVSPDVPRTYAALAERGDVPLTTLHHRAHGRRSQGISDPNDASDPSDIRCSYVAA